MKMDHFNISHTDADRLQRIKLNIDPFTFHSKEKKCPRIWADWFYRSAGIKFYYSVAYLTKWLSRSNQPKTNDLLKPIDVTIQRWLDNGPWAKKAKLKGFGNIKRKIIFHCSAFHSENCLFYKFWISVHF